MAYGYTRETAPIVSDKFKAKCNGCRKHFKVFIDKESIEFHPEIECKYCDSTDVELN